MPEWSEFWRGVEEAAKEVMKIMGQDTMNFGHVEMAIKALDLLWRQNRYEMEHSKYKGKEENGEKPTEKQIAFAKRLKIQNPEQYTKNELSKLIDQKLGK